MKHIKSEHGDIGAAMYLQSGKCGYLIDNKFMAVPKMNLYQDEWGKNLTLSEEWNKFELNIPMVAKI